MGKGNLREKAFAWFSKISVEDEQECRESFAALGPDGNGCVPVSSVFQRFCPDKPPHYIQGLLTVCSLGSDDSISFEDAVALFYVLQFPKHCVLCSVPIVEWRGYTCTTCAELYGSGRLQSTYDVCVACHSNGNYEQQHEGHAVQLKFWPSFFQDESNGGPNYASQSGGAATATPKKTSNQLRCASCHELHDEMPVSYLQTGHGHMFKLDENNYLCEFCCMAHCERCNGWRRAGKVEEGRPGRWLERGTHCSASCSARPPGVARWVVDPLVVCAEGEKPDRPHCRTCRAKLLMQTLPALSDPASSTASVASKQQDLVLCQVCGDTHEAKADEYLGHGYGHTRQVDGVHVCEFCFSWLCNNCNTWWWSVTLPACQMGLWSVRGLRCSHGCKRSGAGGWKPHFEAVFARGDDISGRVHCQSCRAKLVTETMVVRPKRRSGGRQRVKPALKAIIAASAGATDVRHSGGDDAASWERILDGSQTDAMSTTITNRSQCRIM